MSYCWYVGHEKARAVSQGISASSVSFVWLGEYRLVKGDITFVMKRSNYIYCDYINLHILHFLANKRRHSLVCIQLRLSQCPCHKTNTHLYIIVERI
jgi:hypothetical protein